MRKNWDTYFMDLAFEVATRSTCDRLHVGCVIINNNQIIATGYNGSVHGGEHCDDIGHLYNDQGRCIRTIHAEQNAILHADHSKLLGATAYVTHECCETCTKLLVQSGIKKVIFKEKYENKYNYEFTNEIEWVHLNPPVRNKLILVSGHSGSGKSSIMKSIMKNELISITTRERRPEEIEGKDYYFITVEEFNNLIENDELIQHVTYSGNQYGVTRQEFKSKIEKGNTFVIVAYDGMLQYKAFYDDCVTILLYSDYKDVVRQLKNRGENDVFIQKRLSTYQQEVDNRLHYDYTVKNKYGKFNETKELIRRIIQNES